MSMFETLIPAVQDMIKQVLPALKGLTTAEVGSIWDSISDYVLQQLSLHKGVQIPGFGTFTFTRQNTDMGNNKFLLIQRPVFIMAEKLVQLHGLKQNKIHTPGDIPVVPLNFAMVSLDTPFSRDLLESCVKETLRIWSQSIYTKKSVDFLFKGIGILTIKSGKVKMKFLKDFISTLDETGALDKALTNNSCLGKLLAHFNDAAFAGAIFKTSFWRLPSKPFRPDTGDSMLSSSETSRKPPSSAFVFPRILVKDLKQKPPVETIVEEAENGNNEGEHKCKEDSDKKGVREIVSPKNLREKHALTPLKIAHINIPNLSKQNVTGGTPVKYDRFPPSHNVKENNWTNPKFFPGPRCRDHNKEMCYVCIQRAQRLFPLRKSNEAKKKDGEDVHFIQHYPMWKDEEDLLKDQMSSLAIREQSQKTAAYHLGVAEAMRSHKTKKPEFNNAFLVDNRPLTAEMKAVKKQVYSQSLQEHLGNRRKKEIKETQETQLVDRLEPVRLAEVLAEQKAKQMKDKMEKAQSYKRALDAQIKKQSPQKPVPEPDSRECVFGKDERAMTVEMRRRERGCMKHQIPAAANNKRRIIVDHVVDQRQDLQTLLSIQKMDLADRNAEREKRKVINQNLQADWKKSMAEKRQREQEEKAFQR
ncbi:coiled-coil domain-containing protein 81 isoform X2 [Hyaena hyaena]|uniref:coiled-coil domain-containing protein 81 isoform X2 n=1 Tax=Hyaena hyaena TaxID=95912 RepID=UPI0019225547|nr:coiled-coil domain-containing protein 81 isoform X2 [Hyaena hyaena]